MPKTSDSPAAQVKAAHVRAWVNCSQESFDLLTEVGQRWLACMGAHQSNILTEVEQAAEQNFRGRGVDSVRHRANWVVANLTDANRLLRLVRAWPLLARNHQCDIVEQIKHVVGH